ncbi:MAG TPA: HD domain-containing phosphohydrolase [Sideroxyarcus sp.]|nr:HD domain-containing phosphohydrolase [Sideroxyarcus sp.]
MSASENDIRSELESAHRQIEQAHREWMSALDAIDDPLFIHGKDFRIVRANRAYQRRAGIPFKELIGRPYFEVFPKNPGPLPCCLHAEETGKDEADEIIMLGGRTYRSRAFPVSDEAGEYQYSVHTLEDITDSRETEQALRQSRELLLAFIANSPIYAYIKEVSPTESRVLAASNNFVDMIGVHGKDMVGKTMAELFPADFAAKMSADDWHTVSTGEVLQLEEGLNGRSYVTIKFPISQGEKTWLAGYTIDITERKQHEVAMQRANRALRTISAGNQALIHAEREEQLLQEMCKVAVQFGGYRMAWIGYARDDADKTIRQMAQAGFEQEYPNLSGLTWNERSNGVCPAGRAIIGGKSIVVPDIIADSQVNPWREHALQYGYASCIALPLMDGNRSFGALVLFDDKVNVFDEDEVLLLEELSGDLAFGILTLRVKEAHRAHELRLQKNMLQTVEAISGIVEMRDPYTSGHQKRVAALARAIARQMGLSDEEQEVIHLAGIVHDLGKISVPSEILSKPGRLNEIEYSLIKMHPRAGYDILKEIDFSWPIAQMVLQHHERMDGSGYPQGLKGEEILLGARILSVADVVEAMSSHRPYRPGLGDDAALQDILRGRGSRYDAQVVDACLALFREHGYVFSE